jgi:hypothetical protein
MAPAGLNEAGAIWGNVAPDSPRRSVKSNHIRFAAAVQFCSLARAVIGPPAPGSVAALNPEFVSISWACGCPWRRCTGSHCQWCCSCLAVCHSGLLRRRAQRRCRCSWCSRTSCACSGWIRSRSFRLAPRLRPASRPQQKASASFPVPPHLVLFADRRNHIERSTSTVPGPLSR